MNGRALRDVFHSTLTTLGATKEGAHYRLPVGRPGKYLEVQLHINSPFLKSRKNCYVELDRFNANPPPTDAAEEWLIEHLHPFVYRAMDNDKSAYPWCTLPGAGPDTALNVQRSELEDALKAWLAIELQWQTEPQRVAASKADASSRLDPYR